MRVKSQSHTLSSVDDNKYHTVRSKRSTLSNRTSSVELDYDPGIRTPVRRKSDAERSITLSRSTSRTSRKRSETVSSIAGLGKKDRDTFAALMNEDEKDGADTPDVSHPPSSVIFSKVAQSQTRRFTPRIAKDQWTHFEAPLSAGEEVGQSVV